MWPMCLHTASMLRSILAVICGQCLEILNNSVLDSALSLPMAHPWLSSHLFEESLLLLGPMASQIHVVFPLLTPCPLPPPTASPNSPCGGLDLDIGRDGLGQTQAICHILGWGMTVVILVQSWKYSNSGSGWGLVLLPTSDLGTQICLNVEAANTWWSPLDVGWKSRWQALGRRDHLHSFPTQQSSLAAVGRGNL